MAGIPEINLACSESDEYCELILGSDETNMNLFSSDGVQHARCEPRQEFSGECVVQRRESPGAMSS